MSDAAPAGPRSRLIGAIVAAALAMTAVAVSGSATAGAGDPVIAAAGDIAAIRPIRSSPGASAPEEVPRHGHLGSAARFREPAARRVLAVGDTRECGRCPLSTLPMTTRGDA